MAISVIETRVWGIRKKDVIKSRVKLYGKHLVGYGA
jgi:hypothetical protein